MQVGYALLTLVLALLSGSVGAQPLDNEERLELEIYRLRFAQLQATSSTPPVSPILVAAQEAYSIKWHEQESRLREQQIAVHEWQRAASSVVLVLVTLTVIAGIAFSGYQLWNGTRPRRRLAESNLEVDLAKQKVRLQSSVIGLFVLVISAGFLLLFLRDVYRIDVVDTAPRPAPTAR